MRMHLRPVMGAIPGVGVAGLPTPATTWVQLTLNGQPWGLYLAVEQIGQPFLQRHFGHCTSRRCNRDRVPI